ncbi:glucokinase [Methanophagales archaeon]|nr:glucokinase [Methanophagales archaeon]
MGRVIAVDLGGTNLRVALVTEITGEIIKKSVALTKTEGRSPLLIADDITEKIRQLTTPEELKVIRGIGISSAGPLDLCKGVLLNPPNIRFPSVPLVQPIREALGLPVYLINDCRAGVLGEICFGAGKGCENVVYITISTGIGGGAVINGKLLLGRDGNASEIGHFFVDTRYSIRCGCGNYGHWEGYASGKNIPEFFRRWCDSETHNDVAFDCSTSESIFAAARNNDPFALRFLEELGKINGRGISNVIVAYNPELIILDGAVVRHNQNYIVPYLKKNIEHYLTVPEIRVSTLDGLAPLLGASVVARGYAMKLTSSDKHPRNMH